MVNDGIPSTNMDATTFSGTSLLANANNTGGLVMDYGITPATDVATVVTFTKTFSATPAVNVTLQISGAVASSPGIVEAANAGSFSFLGTSGANHGWTAIGSA